MQHGLGAESIHMLDRSDDTRPALPIRFFLEGFDVWLGNNRGTRVSRKHKSLDADKDAPEYWSFSFAEYGDYDLPAMAREILRVNGTCTAISYLGHSLGTTQMFYALGHNSYLQSYFSQVVALSPCFIPTLKA